MSEKNQKKPPKAKPPTPPAPTSEPQVEAAPSESVTESAPAETSKPAGGFQASDGGLPAVGSKIEKVDRNQKVVARCRVVEGNKIQVSKSDPLDPDKDPHVVGSVSKAATIADNLLKGRAWDHDTSLNGHTWWGLKDRAKSEGGTKRASGGKVDTDRDIKQIVNSFNEIFDTLQDALEHSGGDEHRKKVAQAALQQYKRFSEVPEGQEYSLLQNLDFFANQQ